MTWQHLRNSHVPPSKLLTSTFLNPNAPHFVPANVHHSCHSHRLNPNATEFVPHHQTPTTAKTALNPAAEPFIPLRHCFVLHHPHNDPLSNRIPFACSASRLPFVSLNPNALEFVPHATAAYESQSQSQSPHQPPETADDSPLPLHRHESHTTQSSPSQPQPYEEWSAHDNNVQWGCEPCLAPLEWTDERKTSVALPECDLDDCWKLHRNEEKTDQTMNADGIREQKKQKPHSHQILYQDTRRTLDDVNDRSPRPPQNKKKGKTKSKRIKTEENQPATPYSSKWALVNGNRHNQPPTSTKQRYICDEDENFDTWGVTDIAHANEDTWGVMDNALVDEDSKWVRCRETARAWQENPPDEFPTVKEDLNRREQWGDLKNNLIHRESKSDINGRITTEQNRKNSEREIKNRGIKAEQKNGKKPVLKPNARLDRKKQKRRGANAPQETAVFDEVYPNDSKEVCRELNMPKPKTISTEKEKGGREIVFSEDGFRSKKKIRRKSKRVKRHERASDREEGIGASRGALPENSPLTKDRKHIDTSETEVTDCDAWEAIEQQDTWDGEYVNEQLKLSGEGAVREGVDERSRKGKRGPQVFAALGFNPFFDLEREMRSARFESDDPRFRQDSALIEDEIEKSFQKESSVVETETNGAPLLRDWV